MTKLRSILLWSVPPTLALVVGFLLAPRETDLLDPSIPRYCFGDAASGGSSTAWTREGRTWVFGLALRPGFAYPYAAAGLRFVQTSGRIALDPDDSLVVQWRSRTQQSIRIQIQAVEPGTTDTAVSLSYVPLEGALPVERQWSRAAIALRDLSVPLWWDQVNRTRPRSHPGIVERGSRIFFENGMDTPVGIDDTVEIRSLSLQRRSWTPLVASLMAALAFSVLVQVFSRRAGAGDLPVAKPPTEGPTRDVVLGSRREEETARLLEWIGIHYPDPLLTVETAGRAVGIHYRRIPSLLKEAGRGTFPSFVNSLRVEQARRLLRETDRTVGEIALAVGVTNASHFHRLFKKETGSTPLEWRAGGQIRD